MSIQLTILGGMGNAASGGGSSYDDREIKKRLENLEAGQLRGGGSVYDDAAIKREVAALNERLTRIEATRKEFQAGYIPRSEFPSTPENNKYITIPFKTPFSKRPFVRVVLDIKDLAVRLTYQANTTESGFDVGVNYAATLNGLWYEAYLVD